MAYAPYFTAGEFLASCIYHYFEDHIRAKPSLLNHASKKLLGLRTPDIGFVSGPFVSANKT